MAQELSPLIQNPHSDFKFSPFCCFLTNKKIIFTKTSLFSPEIYYSPTI